MKARTMATILGGVQHRLLAVFVRRLSGTGGLAQKGGGEGGGMENLHQVWEDDAVFEGVGHPDQVQRILIHAHLAREAGRVVRT